jgi:hypothetical protein
MGDRIQIPICKNQLGVTLYSVYFVFRIALAAFHKMGGGGQQMMHLVYVICPLIKTCEELCKTIDDIAICFQMCFGIWGFWCWCCWFVTRA